MTCPVCGQAPPYVQGQYITMPCERCGLEICPKRTCAKRLSTEEVVCVSCLELEQLGESDLR